MELFVCEGRVKVAVPDDTGKERDNFTTPSNRDIALCTRDRYRYR